MTNIRTYLLNSITACCNMPFRQFLFLVENAKYQNTSVKSSIKNEITSNGDLTPEGWQLFLNNVSLINGPIRSRDEFFNADRNCDFLKDLINSIEFGVQNINAPVERSTIINNYLLQGCDANALGAFMDKSEFVDSNGNIKVEKLAGLDVYDLRNAILEIRSTLEGFQGVILPNDEPTEDGIYRPNVEGNYAVGLSYTGTEGGIVEFIKSGNTWTKNVMPVQGLSLTEKEAVQELMTLEKPGDGRIWMEDDFSSNKGWEGHSVYPMQPIIANGVMLLKFTAGKLELMHSPTTVGTTQVVKCRLVLRRVSGEGQRFDFGANLGAVPRNGIAHIYHTIPAEEITNEFKTFEFQFMPGDRPITLGSYGEHNLGNVFELKSFIIYTGEITEFQTETAKRLIDIEKRLSSASVNEVTPSNREEFQALLNRNAGNHIQLKAAYIECDGTPLDVPSNTRISGVNGSTFFALKAGVEGDIFKFDAGSSNISLSNLTLKGNTPTTPSSDLTRADVLTATRTANGELRTGSCGINTDGTARNIRIDNLDINDFSLAGIRLHRTHIRDRYIHEFKVNNCTGEGNHIGILADVRAEYHTFLGNNFSHNQYGAFIAGGNNTGSNNQFNANGIGVVVSGTSGENDSHGSFIGGTINHNFSYSIYSIDINVGYLFSAVQCFQGFMCIDNSKGFAFNGGNYGGMRIYLENTNGNYNSFINNMIYPAYGVVEVRGDATKFYMAGNRFMDGRDSTLINNDR